MIKIISYFYNRVYHLLSSIDDEQDKYERHITAWLICSLITAFFILDLILVLTSSREFFIIHDGIFYLLLFLVVGLFYYFFTVRKKKYLKILESYANESKTSIWLGNICIGGFSIITFIIFFVKTAII